MAQTQIARPAQPKFKPAFIVKKLEGKVTRTVHSFDAKGQKTAKQVEVDAGYLVKFPHKGHSIRVKNEAELKRLGFDQTIPLMNDDGEVIATMENAINIDDDVDEVA